MKKLNQEIKTVIAVILILTAVYHYNQNHTDIISPTPIVVPIVPEPIIPEPEITPSNNTCDISLNKALVNQKNLLIVFSAKWCGYCKSLEKDILELVGNKYEICKLDIENPESKELLDHFKVKLVPTSIMVDPKENKEIKRIEGYIKNNYVNWLK